MALYIPDFEGQSQRALQTGLGLGQAIRSKGLNALKEQQMQQQLQSGELGIKQQQQQLQAGELGMQQAQGKITAQQDQMDRIAFADALNMAIATKDDDKRSQVYADLKRQFGQKPGMTQFLDDLSNKSYNEQIQTVYALNQAVSGKAGAGQKQTKTAEEKNFEKLVYLEENGTPEQVATFRKMLNLSKDKTLSNTAEKTLIKAQDEYFMSGESARKMETLAKDISALNIGGGIKATVSETMKEILGSQDEVSDVRRRFRGIRTSQATANLPPGPASDKDIELALSGFPRENANADQIIGFLKGASKLARINEKFNEFKADYLETNNSTKGLIKAWKRKLSNDSYLAEILSPVDNLLKVQDTSVMSDEDLLKKYGGL